jgi:hypothetical protein
VDDYAKLRATRDRSQPSICVRLTPFLTPYSAVSSELWRTEFLCDRRIPSTRRPSTCTPERTRDELENRYVSSGLRAGFPVSGLASAGACASALARL